MGSIARFTASVSYTSKSSVQFGHAHHLEQVYALCRVVNIMRDGQDARKQ